MTTILLTGAGFTHNWGAWLASEAFEYLLGCPGLDDAVRNELWADKNNGLGYETTLARFQELAEKDAAYLARTQALVAALSRMFDVMDSGLLQQRLIVRPVPEKQSDLAGPSNPLRMAAPIRLAQAQSAPAQPAEQSSDTSSGGVEQVVVSASRVVRDGFQAPTPTTVVGSAELAQNAQTNIFDAINQMPVFANSQSTSSSNAGYSAGNNGIDALNQRNLGTNRSLTLMNGHRLVGSNLAGIADISSIPQALVQRVDVVTGGASAAWGADAVGGVVNFILDTKYTGLKGEIESGITTYGDDASEKITLTGGVNFLGGHAHLVMDGEWSHVDGLNHAFRPWYQGAQALEYSIAQTPPGQPEFIVANHVANAHIAVGGIVLSGPLAGTGFGAKGTPYQFNYGTIPYCNATPGTPAYVACLPANNFDFVGGDWLSSEVGDYAALETGLSRDNLFSHFDYLLGDHADVYFEVSYSNVITGPTPVSANFKQAGVTIQCSNPFVPAATMAACAANNITSFPVGTTTTLAYPQYSNFPPITFRNARDTYRFNLGADGDFNLFGTDWKYSFSAVQGDSVIGNQVSNNPLLPLYNLAAQAVTNSTGQIVCADATARAQGCTPLNVMGYDTQNPAAYNWILGTAFEHYNLREQTVSLSFSGEPISNWAGPVSLAFGLEYRQESANGIVDCASSGNCGNPLLSAAGTNWQSGDYHFTPGNYNTKEMFAETVVPLAKAMPFAEELTLDIAGRYTKYSPSIWSGTYKLGLTWTPVDDVRFRMTRSEDARAPNLGELYGSSTVTSGTVVDRVGQFAGQGFLFNSVVTGGGTGVKPEVARSSDLGVIMTPHWIPGFNGSVDYYDITLTGVIATLSAQQTEDACALQNIAAECALITRGANGKIAQIIQPAQNIAGRHLMGYDFEASYRVPLAEETELPGDLTLRFLANNSVTNKTYPNIKGTIPIENAGNDSSGNPNWSFNFTQNYQLNKFNISLTERAYSGGVINNSYIQCTTGCPLPTINNPTINNNHIAGVAYLDLSTKYDFLKNDDGSYVSGYVKIDNVLNRNPPTSINPGTQAWTSPGVNTALYDMVGRYFHAGIRFGL